MAVSANDDPFDSLHSLEETFYQSGYDAGVADGSRAGRIEGRVFGLEKGFEKFVELGKLAGKAEIWKQRSGVTKSTESESPKRPKSDMISPDQQTKGNDLHLTVFEVNPRLEKHVSTFCDLVDPATYDTRNNEDAVADFDDRFKRAKAKAKVIEKIIGEDERGLNEGGRQNESASRRDVRLTREQAQEKNMEDFGRNLMSESTKR